jgi:hypothetical protein
MREQRKTCDKTKWMITHLDGAWSRRRCNGCVALRSRSCKKNGQRTETCTAMQKILRGKNGLCVSCADVNDKIQLLVLKVRTKRMGRVEQNSTTQKQCHRYDCRG